MTAATSAATSAATLAATLAATSVHRPRAGSAGDSESPTLLLPGQLLVALGLPDDLNTAASVLDLMNSGLIVGVDTIRGAVAGFQELATTGARTADFSMLTGRLRLCYRLAHLAECISV